MFPNPNLSERRPPEHWARVPVPDQLAARAHGKMCGWTFGGLRVLSSLEQHPEEALGSFWWVSISTTHGLPDDRQCGRALRAFGIEDAFEHLPPNPTRKARHFYRATSDTAQALAAKKYPEDRPLGAASA